MWRTLVISLLCVFLLVSGLYGSGENSHVQLDIVGGNATSIWLHPYQVSVWSERGYRGSGAFLSQKWIITTASVVAGFEALSLSVRCHSSSAVSGGQKYQVSLMVIHPRFSFNTMLHDVALLLLWRDDILRPIRYVTLARYPLPENTTALLTGWGSTSDQDERHSTGGLGADTATVVLPGSLQSELPYLLQPVLLPSHQRVRTLLGRYRRSPDGQ
ncbi:trypsin-7-like isoform X2 [Homalodisca vitripennis]|uniref:trypsin-7-like isoform X2 n=1 Tax=Homalodisca vitripennis TaxID=197043 RepID=UPI001EECD83D|nr:trypsin-7-like isoform X2 [Homalodisca vitripennis]